MTIARRLIILVAVPLLILAGIGVITRQQLARVEERTRFVTESRVVALARLGDISRSFAELRVNVRSFLLATNASGQAAARAAYEADRAELNRLLVDYADKRITSDQGRRLLNDFRTASSEWMTRADQVMALAAAGRKAEANALLFSGYMSALGAKLSNVSREWIRYNEGVATHAGQAVLDSIASSRQNLLIAIGAALALSSVLGLLTFRRIVYPIRALESSVESIARGDYAKEIPFTKAADETGALARSVDVLKQAAATMDEQRRVKTNAAKLTGTLQGATSLAEFGRRFLSGLVPMLGGGVAGFYLTGENTERIRRIASYGLSEGAGSVDSFRFGEGLVGQCARERKSVVLANLPPGYCRIASGVGQAAPVQAVALPLFSKDTLLGVIEFASFRAFNANERALLEELLPVIAMSLESLQRNLRTQELLARIQEQARQLEEQAAELTQSQAALLAQKEALIAQQQELAVVRQKAEEATQIKSMFLANMSHEIPTDAQAANLPVIAMTAPATIEEKQRCLAAGMNDHISKPIDPTALFETEGQFYKPAVADGNPPPPEPSATAEPQPAPPAEPAAEIKPARPAKRKKPAKDDQVTLFAIEPATTEPATPESPPTVSAPQPAEAVPDSSEPENSTPSAHASGPELPEAAGLDTADGLRRLAGNRKLYLKLLRQFVTDQAGAAEQIRDFLVQGRPAEAERVARMQMKGVAGNLGATAVHAAAANVERAIREQADPAETESLWSVLDQALTAVLSDLKPVLAPKTVQPAVEPSSPVHPALLKKAVREMLPLLTDCDPGAADCLEANRETLRSVFTAETFVEFERHVTGHAFNEALELLKKAARKRNLPV